MVLKELKKNFLKYAKGFCFSENYSVFCTGQRAFICDRELNLLYTVEKLSYVYYASVSPDEKTLLLVSNSNLFYLVDLNVFSVKKYTIRGKFSDNLEGRGCWSFEGKSLYFNVCNRKTLNSALRRYDLSNDMSYEDMLIEKYWLVSIKSVKELNKYMLIGLDRKKQELDRIDCWMLIWFDGASFEEYPIENVDVCDGIKYAEYDVITDTVILYGHSKTFRCDFQGKILENLSFFSMEKLTGSFSNVLSGLEYSNEDLDLLKRLSAFLKMKNVSLDDSTEKICLSSDGKKYYVGTHLGLFIIDAEIKAVLKKEEIDYGVQDIAEISKNVIAVSTWNGVKIFEVVD